MAYPKEKIVRILHVSRQGFYQYLANKDRPWKYQPLADAMKEILTEDECCLLYTSRCV